MKLFFLNSNRGHSHPSNCFIPSLNICPGNDEMKNVEIENKRFKISFRSSPFHCQCSVMKNKTISHNWLALLCARTDTGSPITEYPVTGKKNQTSLSRQVHKKKRHLNYNAICSSFSALEQISWTSESP